MDRDRVALDVLPVTGALRTGYNLALPGDLAGAIFFTLAGDECTGMMLGRPSFEQVLGDEHNLVISTGGLRLTVEAVDEH